MDKIDRENGKKSGQRRLAGARPALPGISTGTFPNPMCRSACSVSPRDLSEPTKTIQRSEQRPIRIGLEASSDGNPFEQKGGPHRAGRIGHNPDSTKRVGIGRDPGSSSNISRTPVAAQDSRTPTLDHWHRLSQKPGDPGTSIDRSLPSSGPTRATWRILCPSVFSLPLNKAPLCD